MPGSAPDRITKRVTVAGLDSWPPVLNSQANESVPADTLCGTQVNEAGVEPSVNLPL